MSSEATLTLSSRELVDTYRALRSLMNQLEPMAEDPGIREYLQRLNALHTRFVEATIASAQER